MAEFFASCSSFVKGLKCLSFPTFPPLHASCLRASKAKIKQGGANGSTIWSLKRSRGSRFSVDFSRLFYRIGAALSPAHRQWLPGSLNIPMHFGKWVPGFSLPLDQTLMDKAGLFIACNALGWKTKKRKRLSTQAKEGDKYVTRAFNSALHVWWPGFYSNWSQLNCSASVVWL